MADSEVLFTNVKIIDGSGAAPYNGEVLVRGKRISRVARSARSFAGGNGTVIDGAGAAQFLKDVVAAINDAHAL